MKRSIILLSSLLLLLTVVPANAQTPVVKAVLFYSPFCGHCHKVINEDIPPLSRQYNQDVTWSEIPEEINEESGGVPTLVALEGNRLQILFVNTTTPLGGELFGKAIIAYQIPEPAGVPALIVGDQYMIGSADIPAQFPGIIEDGLAGGGIDWPDIPDLPELVGQLAPYEQPVEPRSNQEAVVQEEEQPKNELEVAPAEPAPELINTDPETLSIRERVLLDPVGNTLSIMVLIGMTLSLIGIAARWNIVREGIKPPALHWSALFFVLIGTGVAAYLTFVESTGSEAVCGPVGDCNTVQGSQYAMLFGVLPVGVAGLIGYVGLLVMWILSRIDRQQIAGLARIGFFALALLGTLFSIYLTILEPFVIGATCMWCLSSAVIMTALTLLSTGPARAAYQARVTSGLDSLDA